MPEVWVLSLTSGDKDYHTVHLYCTREGALHALVEQFAVNMKDIDYQGGLRACYLDKISGDFYIEWDDGEEYRGRIFQEDMR